MYHLFCVSLYLDMKFVPCCVSVTDFLRRHPPIDSASPSPPPSKREKLEVTSTWFDTLTSCWSVDLLNLLFSFSFSLHIWTNVPKLLLAGDWSFNLTVLCHIFLIPRTSIKCFQPVSLSVRLNSLCIFNLWTH